MIWINSWQWRDWIAPEAPQAAATREAAEADHRQARGQSRSPSHHSLKELEVPMIRFGLRRIGGECLDRGYIIVHGQIAFEGRSTDELRENELVKRYYLGA